MTKPTLYRILWRILLGLCLTVWIADEAQADSAPEGYSLARVNELLANDTPLDSDKMRGTLWYAVHLNQLDAVELLVSKGMQVNFVVKSEETSPLIEAIRQENTTAVQMLLKAGADVNFTIGEHFVDYHQHTSPLIEAVKRNHTAIIQLIMQQNPDVHFMGHEVEFGNSTRQNVFSLARTKPELLQLLQETADSFTDVCHVAATVDPKSSTAIPVHKAHSKTSALLTTLNPQHVEDQLFVVVYTKSERLWISRHFPRPNPGDLPDYSKMTDISGWVDANHFTVGLRPEQQPVFHGALSKQSPAVRIRTGFVLNSCHGSWVQVIDKKGHTGWLGPESLEFVDDKTGDFLRRN